MVSQKVSGTEWTDCVLYKNPVILFDHKSDKGCLFQFHCESSGHYITCEGD